MATQPTQKPPTAAPPATQHNLDAVQAFALMRKDDPTKIRQLAFPLKLSVAAGTLTNTSSALGIIASAEAFILAASYCGLAVMPKETVVVDGQEQPNGYRDANGVIYYRYLCGGLTALGQKYVTESTVSFDLKAYNMQDLLAKMNSHPDAFQLLSKDDPRPMSKSDATGRIIQSWSAYPLDDATVLYLDTKYKEASRWMKDIQQQKKFGDRKAQQMAKRNAIKGHPNIVQLGLHGDMKTVEKTVICRSWYSPKGPLMLDGMTLTVDLDKVYEGAVVDDQGVVDVVEDKETFAAAQSDVDIVDAADGVEETQAPKEDNGRMTNEIAEQIRADVYASLAKIAKTAKGKTAILKARELLDVDPNCSTIDLELDVLEEILKLSKDQ